MKSNNKQSGFTLIELLVVVAIIGILAAIAIPQFAAYRARGYDARSASDCRNAATAEEAFFVTNSAYTDTAASLPGFQQSDTVTVVLAPGNSGSLNTSFKVTCTSSSGTTGYQCQWTSDPLLGAANMVCG